MAVAELVRAKNKWEPRTIDLVHAEEQLEWWHGVGASALGARGAGTEPATVIWDQERVWELFGQLYQWDRLRAIAKYYEIAPIVAALNALQRKLASAIYEAKAYPLHLRAIFACDRGAPGIVTLVGAAIQTPAAAQAFAKCHGGNPHAGAATLLLWLAETLRPRVEHGKVVNERPPTWLAAVQREARTLRGDLLGVYATLRHARNELDREAKARELAYLRAGRAQ